MKAFDAQVRKLPLNKISVKAITEAADISKPAFYLHYGNIEELADAWAGTQARELVGKMDFVELIFTDPKAFTENFFAIFDENQIMGNLLFRRGLDPAFMQHFLRALKQRMHEVGHAPKDDSRPMWRPPCSLAGCLSCRLNTTSACRKPPKPPATLWARCRGWPLRGSIKPRE